MQRRYEALRALIVEQQGARRSGPMFRLLRSYPAGFDTGLAKRDPASLHFTFETRTQSTPPGDHLAQRSNRRPPEKKLLLEEEGFTKVISKKGKADLR